MDKMNDLKSGIELHVELSMITGFLVAHMSMVVNTVFAFNSLDLEQ